MNKSEYMIARALIRSNGKFAYNWLDMWSVSIFKALDSQKDDELLERMAFFIGYKIPSERSRDLKAWLKSNRK